MSTEIIKRKKENETENLDALLEGIEIWTGFYRENPHRFAKDYLNVELMLFQKMDIYMMMHNNHSIIWASRGIGKTWETALFCIIRAILYPGTKICICSATRSQANEVLLKIVEDFCVNYGYGSDNLNREIETKVIAANKAEIKFYNNSWIKVVTASDSARGNRANIVIIDEFRMVDKNIIDTVITKFKADPRRPPYLKKPEYKDNEKYQEDNIEVYLSSCWFKSHWSYQKSITYLKNFMGARSGYYIVGHPYQLAIKEGLLKRTAVEDDMLEPGFDQAKFDMEMGCLPYSDTDGTFFTFEDISNCRKLKYAVYPDRRMLKNSKIPDLIPDEKRILSVDVALLASKNNKKNDASSIIINSAIPSNSNKYTANIIYLENVEGLRTEELALKVRKLFSIYKCTDLAVDVVGQGLGVFDAISRDMLDPETGELYPALSCCNDNDFADRCKDYNAPKVIWAIKGNSAFNNEICTTLRNGFQSNRINLLIPEENADAPISERVKNYSKLPKHEKLIYQMPYIQTTLLVYELINLEYEIKGVNIKIKEKSGMRKDRYSSLAYNYWVQCQLERDLTQRNSNDFSMKKYIKGLSALARKPKMY